MTVDELIDAWRANDRANHEFLKLCTEADLELKPGRGKTVRSNFVHIIGVRRMWAEVAMKKESEAIKKLGWKSATRKEIQQGLRASCELMEKVFRKMAEAKKQGKWPLPLFFAYCVAHEANHRAQIEIALRINGREPDDGALYALWEWGKKP